MKGSNCSGVMVKGSHVLPSLTIPLQKDRKYYRPQHNKENSLKHDVDDIIVQLAPTTQCLAKMAIKEKMHLQEKIRQNHPKVTSHDPALFSPLAKSLRGDIAKYIDKLGHPHRDTEGDYSQFVRLSRESQDYLEYYIKNHFKQADVVEDLKCKDKAIILSLLKNNYKCLTENPPEISHRILLSLAVNPLNDFHYIPWTAFAKFKKLAALRQSKSQSRRFLVSYLMGSNPTVTSEEFWSMVGAVLRKLRGVINESNVERLIQRAMQAGSWVPVEMTRDQLQGLLISHWFFIWQQLVKLIFIV